MGKKKLCRSLGGGFIGFKISSPNLRTYLNPSFFLRNIQSLRLRPSIGLRFSPSLKPSLSPCPNFSPSYSPDLRLSMDSSLCPSLTPRRVTGDG